MHPCIEALFIAPAAGQAMRRMPEVLAMAGRGLQGDRYALGTGYYSRRYDCEVTLIEAEVLEAIAASAEGVAVGEGQHRRNIVTRGLRLRELEGCRLKIGEVVLQFHRPRPPCDYLQRITQPGMTKALGRGAGIGMRVLTGGLLREGAVVEVLPGSLVAPRRRLP